jgi:CHAT domain-containing protein
MLEPSQSRAYAWSGRAREERRLVAFLLFALPVLFMPGCSRHRDPQIAFDRTQWDLRHGDIDAALTEADTDYRQFRGYGREWAWKFTILRARARYWHGMNDEVLSLLDAEPGPPPDGDLVVQKQRLEASAHISLHKFSEAEQDVRKARETCVVQYPACGQLTSTEGRLAMEKSDFVLAERLFEQSLASARREGDLFYEASALLDISNSADEQAHYDEALDRADAAQEIALSQGFADIAETALGNMGWAYYKLGDSEKAEGMFDEARQEARGLRDIESEAGWFNAVGYAYMDEGKLELAEQSFRHSAELTKEINSQGNLVDLLTALAFISEQTGKLDDAKRYADESLALAGADKNSHEAVYPQLVEGRVAARRNDAVTAEADFREVDKSKDTPVFLKWEAERSLARLYEDEKQPGRADGEYRTALSTFEAARCDLHQRVDSRLPFLTNAARIYEDYIHFLITRGKGEDALQVADYTRARTLSEGLGRPCKAKFAPNPLNAPEIANQAGGAILFYALGQEHSYLWAITPQQVRLFPLAANQADINAAVENYRKKLEGPPAILEASNDASVLYQMLVAPAQDFLKKQLSGKNANIFIIPDGGLNSLNFETLMPQPHHYWIEDVTIANAPSLQLLVGSHASSSKLAGKLLLVGNPTEPEAGADNPYPELPNAAAQMEDIKKYFPAEQQQVFARGQASPTAYLDSDPEQFSYIHFVAHGTASRTNPLDSAIILSRDSASGSVGGQDDSFKLYARQIIGTKPLRAELVTISACYSTGKRTYSGEGLVGLSWAFLYKGAHNVVAALWDVSDESTPQLVDEFYGELKKGKPAAAALRTAKLSLLHSSAFHNAFYWAPFQLYTRS